MVAAARKYKRVVQVGTQRRSTPHLVEARDDDHQDREARQDRPTWRSTATTTCARRRIRPTRRRRRISTTRCGPARRRCGPTTRSSIRAAGAPSWNTATASWATCASTCSTWSAGCSISAGRADVSARRHPCREGEQGEHSPTRRPRRSISANLQIVWKHRTWGDPRRSRISLGRNDLRRQGHPQSERQRATTSFRSGKASKPIHRGCNVTSSSSIPEDKTEKDLEKHVAPAIRAPHEELPGRSIPAASRSPTSSRATSPPRAASWPTSR